MLSFRLFRRLYDLSPRQVIEGAGQRSYANIDEPLARHFTVLRAACVGDDSIYCLCRREA